MKRIVSLIVAIALVASMGIVGLPMSVSAATATHPVAFQQTIFYGHDAPNYTAAGTGGVMALNTGAVVSQTVNVDAPMVGIYLPVLGSGIVDISIYAFDTDIATSIAGTAVYTVADRNVATPVADAGAESYVDFSTTIPVGQYVIKFSVDESNGLHFPIGQEVNSSTIMDNGSAATSIDISSGNISIAFSTAHDLSGDITLTQNVVTYPLDGKSGLVNITDTENMVILDMNGYDWTNNYNTAFEINGGTLILKDSTESGNSEVYATSDVIVPVTGSVVANNISVRTEESGCDAFFIKGGNVTINYCNLKAPNAAVHNDSRNGANVNVTGGTFNAPDIFKVRNNGNIQVSEFEGDVQVNIHKQCTADWTFENAFTAGWGYKVDFDAVADRTDIGADGKSTGDWRTIAHFAALQPGESQDNPLSVENEQEITVPAGTTYYLSYQNMMGSGLYAMEAADVNGNGEFTITYNGADTNSEEGMLEMVVAANAFMGRAVNFAITNNSNEDANYLFCFADAQGSYMNPQDMVIGTNNVTTFGTFSGVWLDWTAPEAGTLTITMNSESWLYTAELNGSSATDYTTHYSDDDPVVPVLEVEVEEGDVFAIMVNTYDPTNRLDSNPVGTVVFEAAFDTDDEQPSEEPSEQPSEQPTEQPTEQPSEEPSEQPSEEPSEQPSEQPSEEPSEQPSEQPSEEPSEEPSEDPSEEPETDAPATDVPETDAPETDAPETGDSSVTMFAVIAMMAAAAFVATVVLKKRAR